MRTCARLAAVGMLLLAGSLAQAGFVVTTSRAPITTGTFAGNDGVTLFIRNDGAGTTDPTFGADIIYYSVALSSNAPNPQFFIHTWDNSIHNDSNALNTRADFGWRGFILGDGSRDGRVNLTDLNIIGANINSTTATWGQGDFNNDQRVNLTLGGRYYPERSHDAASWGLRFVMTFLFPK